MQSLGNSSASLSAPRSHRGPAAVLKPVGPVERMEPRLLLSGTSAKHPKVVAVATGAATHVTRSPTKGSAGKAGSAAAKAAVAAVPSGWRATPIAATVPAAAATAVAAAATGQSTPGYGYTPAQMRTAYGVSSVVFGSVQGSGAGETIAIIDAGDDPYGATDINTFSSAFGLPLMNQTGGPTFTKLSQTGTATLPAVMSGWTGEESLDIEWAHAMAPSANIILFEANNAGSGLTVAAETAAAHAGVGVVSMSFGGGEYSGESSSDAAFTTPSGHTGVTFLASTGDSGTGVEYPAASVNVVAVGGTTLNLKGTGTYSSETGWSGSGGGISADEAQPSYQSGVVSSYSTTKRTVPDVSIDADPGTGVPICDSYDYGTTTPWLGGGYVEGGTSLAAPLWAGLTAITDQGRVAAGLTSLNGKTQTLPRIYQLRAADFHDVTTINNGSTVANAGVGYDLNTGRGSPIASALVPDLAGDASVTGRVFQDDNANGVYDGTDSALTGQTVYLDLNNDGVHTANEPTATVGSTGTFTISSLVTGGDLLGGLTGTARLLTTPPAGDVAVGTGATFTTAYATATTAIVGLFPTAYADATAGDAYTVRVSPTSSTTLQVLVNGTVAYSAPTTLAPSLSVTFAGVGDSLAVDFANGVPVPSGGLTVNGSAAANGDTLSVLGTTGNDTIAVNGGTVVFGSSTITYANVPNLAVDPRGGTDSLTVNAGTVTVPAQTAGSGYLARTFSNLTVAAGAKLALASAAARTDRTVVVLTSASALSVASTAQLNLGANDLVVKAGAAAGLTTVSGLIGTGFANGTWAGNGIASAAAAATHVTALATVLGSQAAVTSIDGVALAAADVLVRYTYYGDANADGVVNAADYIRTDTGFVLGDTGWANGDYNYDGVVDGSDYSLIDNGFNQQAAAL